MFTRTALWATFLIGIAAFSAAAGETEPEEPGEVIRLVDRESEGRVIGWVRNSYARAHSDRRASLNISITEQCTEVREELAKLVRPGNGMCLWARWRGRPTRVVAEPSDVAVYRRFGPGDLIEVEFYVEGTPEKGLYFRPVSIRRLRTFPAKGKLAGTVLGIGKQYMSFMIHEVPPGAEHMRGRRLLLFYVDVTRRLDRRRGYQYKRGPRTTAMLTGVKAKDPVEVAYSATERFYLAGIAKLDRPLEPLPEETKPGKPKLKPAAKSRGLTFEEEMEAGERGAEPAAAAEPEKPEEDPEPAEESGEPEGDPEEAPADDLDEF